MSACVCVCVCLRVCVCVCVSACMCVCVYNGPRGRSYSHTPSTQQTPDYLRLMILQQSHNLSHLIIYLPKFKTHTARTRKRLVCHGATESSPLIFIRCVYGRNIRGGSKPLTALFVLLSVYLVRFLMSAGCGFSW